MANEPEWASGPYHRSDATVYALNPEGYNSMSALVQNPHTSTRTLEATAQLFAAAPDMYEALQQYEAFLERTIAMVTGGADISDANFATSMNALLDMSAAALSKAMGE